MKHLSGVDNLFLAMDRPDEHLHVACLAIYDPSTAPDGKVRLKSILNHFAGRLNQWKLFRRRLVSLPFGLDRPYWIEDPEIDLEYHIRHIALPHPGDWRQLMIQVARIHSRPLDMTKPLWEAYVIEGLDNIPGVPRGGFAVYTKVHHAAIDGEAGAQLIGAIHSLSPVSAADEDSGSTRVVADREPSALELYARAAGNRAHQVLDASKLMVTVGSRLVTAGKGLLTSGRALATGKDLLAKALERASKKGVRGGVPQTRFDEPLSSHRVVDAVGFPLEDFNSIRQSVDNVTLNDIFLAAVGGGLRRYLEAKGELPDTSVVAMVPITTRGDIKDVEVSNQVSFTGVPLASHIADPLQRLQAVRRSSAKSKAVSAALGKDLAARLLNILPAALTELLLTRGLLSLANVTVSNVRGPSVPLYMAGARMQMFLPVSAIYSGLGLNVTGVSYHGTFWVCFVSCRTMMPDPAFFAECLKESFDELAAAAASVAPAATKVPATSARPAKPKTEPEVPPESVAPAPKRRRTSTPKPLAASSPASEPAAIGASVPKRAAARKPRKAAVAAATTKNEAAA
jgi:WS/DGAT/MGAT family acyltransferase